MPWHGLGTVLSEYPTRDEAKAIAHNWEPVTATIYRAVPGFTEGVLAECGHFLPSDPCEVCPTTRDAQPQPTTRYEAIQGQQHLNSLVAGKSVYVAVDHGGRRVIKKKKI